MARYSKASKLPLSLRCSGRPLLRDTRGIIKRLRWFFISFLIRVVKFTMRSGRRGARPWSGRRRGAPSVLWGGTEGTKDEGRGRIEFTLPPSQLTLRREFEITSKVETRLKAILQGRSGIIRFRGDRE